MSAQWNALKVQSVLLCIVMITLHMKYFVVYFKISNVVIHIDI